MAPVIVERMRNLILKVLLGVSVVLFFWHGRSDTSYGDLVPVYGSVRCILDGVNPYSPADVKRELFSHGADLDQFGPQYWREYYMLYPPLTYLLLAPFGLLSYPAAGELYFWLSGITFVAAYLLFVQSSPRDARTVVGLGAFCVVATSGTLLSLGQVTTFVLAFLVLGSSLVLSSKTRWTGAVLLFVGACLKPQLVLPILVFFCIRPQTRKAACTALGAFAAASLAAGLFLTCRLGTLSWLASWREQIQLSLSLDQRIDTGIVNLSALTKLISASPAFYKTVDVLLFIAIATLLCLGYLRAASTGQRDWLALAAMCFFTLMLTYHRTYDMRIQILAFPALGILWTRARKAAALLTVCSALQLFSTALRIEKWAVARFGENIASQLWFRLFVERQQAVVGLATTVGWVLVLWMAGSRWGAGAPIGSESKIQDRIMPAE